MCFITKKAHQKEIDELKNLLDRTTVALENTVNIVAGQQMRIKTLELKVFPPVPPPPDIFDPKAEVYPDELGGMKLGFVTVKKRENSVGEGFPELNYVAEQNKLRPYENEDWGTDTASKRINVNPSRLAVAINRKGNVWENVPEGLPPAFGFDGGALAYEVCPAQVIDGKKVPENLYLLLSDVVN
jgi:hypothetical protein